MQDVVIITAGLTDLQFKVIQKSGTTKSEHKAEVKRSTTRRTHGALLEATKGGEDLLQTFVVDLDGDRFRRPAVKEFGVVAEMVGNQLLLEPDPGSLVNPENGKRLDFEAVREGARYVMFLPKLQPLFTQENIQPTAVAVLNTVHPGNDVPIALGPLISKFCAHHFKLQWAGREGQVCAGRTGWVDILREKETLFGKDGSEYPIQRLTAERIRAQVAELAANDRRIVLCDMGGITQVKEVLRAAAQLYFGPRVAFVTNPDVRDGEFKPVCAGSVLVDIGVTSQRFAPAASLALRRQSLDLMKLGEFVAVRGILRMVNDQKEKDAWVTTVRRELRALCGLDPLRKGLPRCATAAVEVEVALRREDFVEAILSFGRFIDIAVVELFENWVREMNGAMCETHSGCGALQRVVRFPSPLKADHPLLQERLRRVGSRTIRHDPLLKPGTGVGVAYDMRLTPGVEMFDVLRQCFGQGAAGAQLKAFTPLKQLYSNTVNVSGVLRSVQGMRNDLAHSADRITGGENAKQLWQTAFGMTTKDAPADEPRFLGRRDVAEFFGKLVTDWSIGQAFAEAEAGVRQRLSGSPVPS